MMKKLYENIENIYIKGSIANLSEMVTAMDISLQNIAEGTERLSNILMRYADTNKGTQYEKVVRSALDLRDDLYEASLELNEMQNQIVVYQNKIYRYEDMVESAQMPNAYLVDRKQLSVDTIAMQFNRTDMMEVAAYLRNYSETVLHHLRSINDKKNNVGYVWQDRQYNDFAEFIEGITLETVNAIKVFDEYVSYLEEKIRELN